MKKLFLYSFTFILLVFLINCSGYKPIFQSTNLQFEISDYTLEGDKILSKKIYSKLLNLSKSKKNEKNLRSIIILINTTKSKNATSKDSSGKILEYKITINAHININDSVYGDQILNQTFVSSSSYKIEDQYSETVKLENKSVQNLIDKIYQDMLIILSQKI